MNSGRERESKYGGQFVQVKKKRKVRKIKIGNGGES